MRTIILVAVVGLAVGCGVTEAELGEPGEVLVEDGSELGASAQTYVQLRRDIRRCMAPLCGGYFVHDVNRAALREVYVSHLDFSQAKLDEATQAHVTGAGDGEVVLKGKLGPVEPQFRTRPFLVTAAWRGMPGVRPAAGELFFRAERVDIRCIAAPCPSYRATKLHGSQGTLFHDVGVARASLPAVDRVWLERRVTDREALVTARFVPGTQYSAGRELVLDVSQVFVKLPDVKGPCPMFPIAQCTGGKTMAMARTADRCLVPAGCVTMQGCSEPRVVCPAGYRLDLWRGGTNACLKWACDPEFVR